MTPNPKITLLVVAYNAESTLQQVLNRIPDSLIPQISCVLVCDDASTDSTHDVVTKYQQSSKLPITIVKHPLNLGYGGNQKYGYTWAIENNMDFVVMLHGDGQYAPEELPNILQPLVDDVADVVLGSRMIAPVGALRGGMPLYKFVGNIVLTRLQNLLVGAQLSEWHTGYSAYRVRSLTNINFVNNSNAIDFDTQIILQMIGSNQRIAEISIPTFYGQEISHVNSIKYGLQILGHTLRFRFSQHQRNTKIKN